MKVIDEVLPGVLIVFGGDTAASILKSTGAKGLIISCEIEKYIPEGQFTGGKLNNVTIVTIVTKAGGLGTQEALVNIIGNYYSSDNTNIEAVHTRVK